MSDAINPAQAFGQWYGVGQALGNAAQVPGQMQAYQAQQAQQAEQQKMMEELRAKALAPTATAKDRQQWVMFHAPEQAKQLTEAFSAIDKTAADEMNLGAGKVVAYLRAGNKDAAKALLEERALMGENSGNMEGAKFSRSLAQTIDIDPRVAENYFIDMMAFSPGGDKVIENLNAKNQNERDNTKLPYELAKMDAETRKLLAEEAKIRLENERPQGTEIDESARKIMNAAVESAIGSDLLASQAVNLATEFDKLRPQGGWAGNFMEALKKAAGGQDKLTTLRQEYVKLRNTDVLKNLPPGVASDKDIEIALKAFPDENANPEQVSSFLRGVAKLQGYQSSVNKAKSEWVNQNGSLGPARGDFNAGGRPIKKGDGFFEFIKSIPVPNVIGTEPSATPGGTPPGSTTPKKVVEGEF